MCVLASPEDALMAAISLRCCLLSEECSGNRQDAGMDPGSDSIQSFHISVSCQSAPETGREYCYGIIPGILQEPAQSKAASEKGYMDTGLKIHKYGSLLQHIS
ncbi:hypothetical protein [Methanomethylovorans hollandica]|jgi:hypothetical protein|uniref:hypothetical protein n=1 Tax=Methanomethylovorans hollandica TaxID=101192 RepID=UPI0006628EDF|nr:hypothetical protein [Methanomethylovorans hollandica]